MTTLSSIHLAFQKQKIETQTHWLVYVLNNANACLDLEVKGVKTPLQPNPTELLEALAHNYEIFFWGNLARRLDYSSFNGKQKPETNTLGNITANTSNRSEYAGKLPERSSKRLIPIISGIAH